MAGAEIQGALGPYTVSVARNISEQVGRIKHTIVFCSAIGLVAIALCIAIGSLMIASAIKPIAKLRRGAAELAAGKYGSRIQLSGTDEISALAVYFNEMAAAIQRHVHDIEATSEERQYMLSAIAHEMKTPVTAVAGYSYALTHSKLTKRQTADAAAAISSQSLRLERLSSKLTQLLSLQEGNIERKEICMNTLIAEAVSILLPIAEKSGVSLSYESDQTLIYGDSDLLICLVTNLFDNARKANAASVNILQSENVIEISDNGQGIPQDKLEKVMLPFYKADESRGGEGFGIGLSLCKRIAEAHGASIRLSSDISHGTTIVITF